MNTDTNNENADFYPNHKRYSKNVKVVTNSVNSGYGLSGKSASYIDFCFQLHIKCCSSHIFDNVINVRTLTLLSVLLNVNTLY